MRFEVLGPLRVVDHDETLAITAPKMEVVLATLLIKSGQIVSFDELVNEIWSSTPPRRAVNSIYVYISNLRKMLDRSAEPRSRIHTHALGYSLSMQPGELDLFTFQQVLDRAREAARSERHETAARLFTEALGLWRGPALSGLDGGPIAASFLAWTGEMRIECIQRMVESRLALGQHRELVGLLQNLIPDFPLHEAFYRQLMLALYRCERRADALAVYRMARRTLQTELGLEPALPLRALHQHILTAHGLPTTT